MTLRIALNYYISKNKKHEEFVEAIESAKGAGGAKGEAVRLRYEDFEAKSQIEKHLQIKKHLEDNKISGLILTGGPDILPGRYKSLPEKKFKENLMKSTRDRFDFELIDVAWEMQLPILAVCLGPQELNVYMYREPDSLIRHIEDEGHRSTDPGGKHHLIKIKKDTRLHEIIGKDTVRVASFHHQAIGEPWKEFTVSAWAEDGVIEAIEYQHLPSGRWVLGVQWHPERMLGEEEQKRLFSALLKEARAYAMEKGYGL